MSDLKAKTISSLLWKVMERGGNAVVSLVVQIVLARLLTPNEFGLLAIIIVFVNIGAVFVQSGLNSALIQISDIEKEDYSTVFWISFVIAIFLYMVIFGAAPLIANFYNMSELIWPLRAISIILIINAYSSIQVAIVTRDLVLKKTFYATLASVFVSGITGIALAYIGWGIWALVIQQLLYQFVNCLVLGLQIDWHPEFAFSFLRAKKLFSFGWKLLVSGLMNTIYQSLSSLIIGKQFSQHTLGLVSQGEKYPQAIGNMLDGAIQPVMLSAVSRVQNDLMSVKNLTRRALKTSSFFVFPIMGMFAVAASSFTQVFLGNQWLLAVPFFQLYCFIYSLYPLQSSVAQAIIGVGKSGLYLKLEVFKKLYGVLLLIVAAFFIRDVYAVVVGIALTNIIAVIVNSMYSRSLIHYGLLEQLRDIAPAIFLTGVSVLASCLLFFLNLAPSILLLLQCFVVTLTYVLFARLFSVEEFNYLMVNLKKLIKNKD